LHMQCEYLGVDDLSLLGMLQGAPLTTVVAWRPFCPYLSLYLDTGDDEFINE